MALNKKIGFALASLVIIGASFVFGVRVGYANRPAIDKIVGVSG